MPKFLLGRRQFALGAAAAATTALALPGKALLGHDLLDQSTDVQSLDKKTRAAMAKLSASAPAEVEMKVASIFRKYGDRLNDEQKADIRRIMAESQEGLEKMPRLQTGKRRPARRRVPRLSTRGKAERTETTPAKTTGNGQINAQRRYSFSLRH